MQTRTAEFFNVQVRNIKTLYLYYMSQGYDTNFYGTQVIFCMECSCERETTKMI